MRKIFVGAAALGLCLCLTGCGNKQIFDMQRTFDEAIVKMPDGEVKTLKIKSWKDYEGEQLQITTDDGQTYLVSSFNCVLIDE